jgi:hypothetical protein
MVWLASFYLFEITPNLSLSLPHATLSLPSQNYLWTLLICTGGAGTTQTSMEAGVPTIITPFFFDQARLFLFKMCTNRHML